MAEATKPRNSGNKDDGGMDTQKLRDLLSDWHLRMRRFENKDEREREELLHELEENMPTRLLEVEGFLRKFLEDGLEFGNIYSLLLSAHDMTIILGKASSIEGVEGEQLHRIERLHDQLKVSQLFECRKIIDLTEKLLGWSAKLELWTSSKESVKKLLEILDSFEDVSDTTYIWLEILEKIMDLSKQFQNDRWPDILLDAFIHIVKALQLLNTRLKEARDVSSTQSGPMADRVSGMIASCEDVFETKAIIKDLVEIHITSRTPEEANIGMSLQRTENFETDMLCLTKRPIGRIRDLLLTKDSISLYNMDVTTGPGIQIAREKGGKVDIFVSNDVSMTYRSYHLCVQAEGVWRRISATEKNNRLSVALSLSSTTMMCVTSMEIGSKSTLVPNKEYSHICPGDSNVVLDFSEGTVLSTQQINIMLELCKFPLSEIAGYSDIVCIQHDEKFLKPVTVTLPVTMIGDNDIATCDLFCVHIGDDGVTINEDVKVEILNGNVCRFATKTFGRNVIHARKKTKQAKNMGKFLQQLLQLHGQSRPHNILLFIGEGFGDNTWKLHAEVVPQPDVKNTIEKRRTEMSLFELPKCRSPSLIVSGIQQIEVGTNGSLSVWEGAQRGRVTINIIQGAEDNFIQVPVTRTDREKIGIVHFKAAGRDQILHSAYFGQHDMNRFSTAVSSYPEAFTEMNTSESQYASSNPATLVPQVSGSGSFGFFSDKSMHFLVENITPDNMFSLAICLKIPNATYQNLKANHHSGLHEFNLNLIKYWLHNEGSSEQQKVEKLCFALRDIDLQYIAETVESVFKENRPLQKVDFQH